MFVCLCERVCVYIYVSVRVCMYMCVRCVSFVCYVCIHVYMCWVWACRSEDNSVELVLSCHLCVDCVDQTQVPRLGQEELLPAGPLKALQVQFLNWGSFRLIPGVS